MIQSSNFGFNTNEGMIEIKVEEISITEEVEAGDAVKERNLVGSRIELSIKPKSYWALRMDVSWNFHKTKLEEFVIYLFKENNF